MGDGATTNTGKTPAIQTPVKGSILHASSPDAHETQEGVVSDIIRSRDTCILGSGATSKN